MRKIFLLLVVVSSALFSCQKNIKQPLDYNVTNDALQNGVFNIYIPDTGTYDMPVLVKFLSGYNEDKVTLKLTGMPAHVTVTPTTITAIPTFTEHFIFKIDSSPLGSYPLTLTASSPGLKDKVFSFNIIVVPANVAVLFIGLSNGTNSCNVNYNYTVTGTLGDTTNTLYINNFGGYGPEVNARIVMNSIDNSLVIPKQVVGNGTTLWGTGSFTTSVMTVNYYAVSTPGGPADQCTVVLTK